MYFSVLDILVNFYIHSKNYPWNKSKLQIMQKNKYKSWFIHFTDEMFPYCGKWPISPYLRRFSLWACWTNECNWTCSTNAKERSRRQHQEPKNMTTVRRWWWDYWQIGNFQFSLRRGNKLSRVEKTRKKVKRSRREWRVSPQEARKKQPSHADQF